MESLVEAFVVSGDNFKVETEGGEDTFGISTISGRRRSVAQVRAS